MAFSIYINDTDIFPVIYLKDEQTKTEAVIYSFGALWNAFFVDGKQNVVDSFNSCLDAKENITNGFKSCKLSPFPGRIPGGQYVFHQHEYKTGKFFLGGEAIHGLLYDALFEVIDFGADEESSFVTLQYKYAKSDEGFPFSYLCTITYKLERKNKIYIVTEIRNISDNEMPLSDGWHPYFMLGESVNDLYFQINSEKMLEYDDRLVPTGKISSFNKFQTPELFGETFLDNCFVLRDFNKPACVLKMDSGLQLTVRCDESYPFLQIYTPPHRRSIAIENLSAAPNAFNNAIGLTILKSGETKKFSAVYQFENV